MLPSPATERTKSKNIPLDLQLTSCEAQRDLVFARVREPLNQRNHRRGSQNRHFETPQASDAAGTGVSASRCRRTADRCRA